MRGGRGALALVAAIAAPAAHAAPFSFLERPTDQIAVPGYVSGTTVTPEGSLYTGWAELVLRGPFPTFAGAARRVAALYR